MKNFPIPDNRAIKEAVKWISEELKIDPFLKKKDLVNDACLRFDLSPSEADYLLRAEDIVDDKN